MEGPNLINPGVIKKLRDAFEKEKGPALDLINKNNPNCQWDADARYTTYSIETIQNYLKGLTKLNVTEVKVCLGQYEKDTCPTGHENYEGLTTILFVPVKKNGGNLMMTSEENNLENGDDDGLNRGGTGIPPGGQ